MIYGEGIYSEDIYAGIKYSAEWVQTYEFTYVAGVTVFVTASLSATIPTGTKVSIYAGESLATLELIEDGVQSPVTFLSTSSGATDLYIKLVLERWNTETPVISSLDLLVHQETSLYTIATLVLEDGLENTGVDYSIDSELRNYLIPYAWFPPVKHRTALKQIAEACAGVCYQGKDGIVRLESGQYLSRNKKTVVLEIGEDKIYTAKVPVTLIRNSVSVKTLPYKAQLETTVWETSASTKINNGEKKTFDFWFTDYEAVIDAYSEVVSDPVGATVDSETLYDWGGSVTILGSSDDQDITVNVEGKPLQVVGSKTYTVENSTSIRVNGRKNYSITDNKLIQTDDVSVLIADSILETLGQERRDIEIDWRGDPRLELGDRIKINGITCYTIRQELSYDGILTARLTGRKV